MTRIFKNRWFVRYARKEDIEDAALCEAIHRVAKGLIDADLGGGVIKQRVARRGEGRSGGHRTIIAYRSAAHAFFIYGFAKSARDNISQVELAALKSLARLLLPLNADEIAAQSRAGEIEEVICHGEVLSQ